MTQPRLVGGRYELGELIGYGGMAEVHRGRDLRLGRDVAIKVLRADLARDPSFLNRFRREAQSAAGLNHPSIVSVYDTGEDVGGEGTTQPYIVMEFVEGRTLRDILKAERRLPVRRAMEIVADVSAALDFSHRAGLIHRDVKPANVMITENGAVKVMDFGIARAIADNSATVTQTANVIGTAQYLSPEQARGESVDARSDVYSTGCLLYELVTGVPPFQGDSPVAVAYQHVRENATAPSSRVPGLPRALDSIVMKALAKNPQNRYQSANDMRSDLQRALADQPVSAESVMTDDERTQFIARTPAPVPVLPITDYPDDETPRRTGLVWVAVVVALLIVVGVGAFFIWKLAGTNQAAKTYAVPEMIGLTPDKAQAELVQIGNPPNCSQASDCKIYLLPNPQGDVTSDACDNGQKVSEDRICKITDQNGNPVTVGTKLAESSTIYYATYQIATVNAPYLIGSTFNAAIEAGQKAGLVIKQGRPIDTFSYAKGEVVVANPQNGTPLKVGATILVRLSTGMMQLPDLRGKQYDEYKARLNALGFLNVSAKSPRTTQDRSKAGTVYDVDPTVGNAYAKDIAITLYTFRYKAPPPPPPTCDPAKTPTPTGVSTPASPTGSPPSSSASPSSGQSSSSSSASNTSTNTLPACGQS